MRFISFFLAVIAIVPFVAINPAQACGGFFCNSSSPVNQAAERIIFSQDDDGNVSAIIQIQYQGPSEEFAWMLPISGSPEIQVSSNDVFTALQLATNPTYTLNTTVEGDCRSPNFRNFGGADSGVFPSADAGTDAPPPVSVVNRGSVGPYDFVVISVEDDTESPGQLAVDWLRDNDYDVNELGVDRLSPYLAGGMNLLAFRLTKGNDAGSIRPVILSFGRGNPSIPIRPTAVAATDDMGVMVWVLGPHRAVPENYMSLELNEALINWVNPGVSYGDVVTRAANEAGGQGFVTEFAGDASPFDEVVYPSSLRSRIAHYRDPSNWESNESHMLQAAIRDFLPMDGFREAALVAIPIPDPITIDTLQSCTWEDCWDGAADIPDFEPSVFMAALDQHVIEPVENSHALFEGRAYLTRFYTTMSAHEMTRDPMFSFNPDLGDYSNRHTAERVIHCSPSVERAEAPWIVTLADGGRVRGAGRAWPFEADRDRQPANRMIRRVGPEGSGEVVEDNREAIQDRLRAHNRQQLGSGRGVGCSVGPHSTQSPLGMLTLLALGCVGAFRRQYRG